VQPLISDNKHGNRQRRPQTLRKTDGPEIDTNG